MKTPREAAIEYWNRANDTKLETAIAARDSEWKARVSAGTVSLAELEKELAAARAENAKLRARVGEAERLITNAPLKGPPASDNWKTQRGNYFLMYATPSADSPVPADDRRCPRCEAPMSMFSSASTCDRCAGLWTKAYQAGREFERIYGVKSADPPVAGGPDEVDVSPECQPGGPHLPYCREYKAPDNGMLAPVWAKLRELEADQQASGSREATLADWHRELEAKVAALEEQLGTAIRRAEHQEGTCRARYNLCVKAPEAAPPAPVFSTPIPMVPPFPTLSREDARIARERINPTPRMPEDDSALERRVATIESVLPTRIDMHSVRLDALEAKADADCPPAPVAEPDADAVLDRLFKEHAPKPETAGPGHAFDDGGYKHETACWHETMETGRCGKSPTHPAHAKDVGR